jgi:hypothetical protein
MRPTGLYWSFSKGQSHLPLRFPQLWRETNILAYKAKTIYLLWYNEAGKWKQTVQIKNI